MKQYISVFVVLLLVTAGCAKKAETAKTATKVETPKTAKAPAETKKVEAKPKVAAEPKKEAAKKAPVAKAETKPAAKGVIKVTDVGFATPESVLHDTKMDLYYVSNINGSPLAADGNGFISRIAPNGKMVALKWLDGTKKEITLNAPKGMVLVGRTLFVTDLDHVRKFDAESSTSTGNIKIAGSSFLNDVVLGSDGAVYVSDSGLKGGEKGFVPSGTDAIYRIAPKADKAEVVVKNTELGRPNGLLHHNNTLWVVTFGTGELYSLDKSGKRANVKKSEKGALDGLLLAADGQVIFSSWEGSAVYKGPLAGPYTAIIKDVKAPADIGYDAKRKRILIPLFMSNAVEIHSI